MIRTIKARGEIRSDHTITVIVPDDVPVGPADVTLTFEDETAPKIRTFGDLLDSGFVGMYADRDDLPRTNEEFRTWRKRLWEGTPDDAT
jgi:hypothetical protein